MKHCIRKWSIVSGNEASISNCDIWQNFVTLIELYAYNPRHLKYWVGVQWDQSYLLGRCLFSLGWPFYCRYHNQNTLWGRCVIKSCTPSLPFGLVKTESDFIARSVETGLGRWMLVVAVISVHACPYLAFLDLTCHLEDTWIGASGCTAPCDIIVSRSKVTKKLLHHQQSTGVILLSCRAWKCVPTAFSGVVDISEAFVCYLLRQMSSQWGSQNLLQGLVSLELTAYLSVFNLFLTHEMAILPKGRKPDNFESHNS